MCQYPLGNCPSSASWLKILTRNSWYDISLFLYFLSLIFVQAHFWCLAHALGKGWLGPSYHCCSLHTNSCHSNHSNPLDAVEQSLGYPKIDWEPRRRDVSWYILESKEVLFILKIFTPSLEGFSHATCSISFLFSDTSRIVGVEFLAALFGPVGFGIDNCRAAKFSAAAFAGGNFDSVPNAAAECSENPDLAVAAGGRLINGVACCTFPKICKTGGSAFGTAPCWVSAHGSLFAS